LKTLLLASNFTSLGPVVSLRTSVWMGISIPAYGLTYLESGLPLLAFCSLKSSMPARTFL
jgi:hypothetical protein